jgi:methylmalonyl-CoA decarboxylase subunit alpha
MSEMECFEQIKKLISYIPWNNKEKAQAIPAKLPKKGKKH